MPHGAACTCYPVTTRNSHDHQYHQTPLSRTHDGTGRKKRKGRNDQREWLCMFQNGKKVSDFILHAWCVGRNFCGYLILRFFPNRKNSQNIVSANNSNNKVISDFVPRSVRIIQKKCTCFPIGDVRDRRRERYNRVYVLNRARTNRVSLYFGFMCSGRC